ncbi:hypothetical protein Poli38472_007371 [Pythium oligandrum]|uniref:Uncharacterized protein n=1 Tax=Pythium oligandrum TaxID=41045 RepID=A0A8K1C9M1_PYTOL|nr:hypothetical protein Poli38472_007371 [Pythium oligandrum]|eukprot:TMW59226.1 hypothetical protein Poli38472_007371 [Pythium oligandrum]
MTYWFRFIRPARALKPNEVQAKIPMLQEPRSKRAWSWIPVRDPEIYPLLICVATGFSLLAVYNVHNLVLNPDLSLSKQRRETQTIERYDPEDAQKFTRFHTRLATVRPNPVNTSDEFSALRDKDTPYPSSAVGKETVGSTE